MYDRLYHYCDRLTAADIRRDGVIRAAPLTLHRDMLARDEGLVTPPIVWLTINPIMDGTIVGKMIAGGWPKTLVGDLCRFALPGDYAPLGLAEYTESVGIDHAWWDWAVRTGEMAGSNYTTWRVLARDIPAADWLAVEVMAGRDASGGVEWRDI